MNEELEYAKMLEIPVSTVSVIKKQRRSKQESADIKDKVISKVNAKLSGETETVSELPNDSLMEEYGERIDTVQIFPSAKKRKRRLAEWFSSQEPVFEEDASEVLPVQEEPLEQSESEPLDEPVPTDFDRLLLKKEKRARILLTAETAVAVALCGGIFLTNALMPNSAVNTFFSGLFSTEEKDERTYTDFTLDSVVGDFSSAELSLSEEGVLTFTQKGCVYPAVDGKVQDLTRTSDGKYDMTVCYSDSFTGVFSGLDYAYYQAGQDVCANVPIGFSDGETAVQVTLFWKGELLNCLELTDENCLTWATETENA
ncbi:MAG: hypothetical protein IJY38_03765 [Clostridia bacterium]|nr:hypothetical protein [Clostridia bacterium]